MPSALPRPLNGGRGTAVLCGSRSTRFCSSTSSLVTLISSVVVRHRLLTFFRQNACIICFLVPVWLVASHRGLLDWLRQKFLADNGFSLFRPRCWTQGEVAWASGHVAALACGARCGTRPVKSERLPMRYLAARWNTLARDRRHKTLLSLTSCAAQNILFMKGLYRPLGSPTVGFSEAEWGMVTLPRRSNRTTREK